MKFKAPGIEADTSTAIISMERGDLVSISFRDLKGDLRILHVSVQGYVMVAREDKTNSAMLVRSAGTLFQEGD